MIGLAMLFAAAASQPADHPPTRARPLEPLANWFSDRDYPAEAIRRHAEGVTRFRLVIDERGNVRSCTVIESSNDSALDAATCSIMSIRGRFEPARDGDGQAVEDSIESRIRWVLPDERPPTLPFEPIRYVTTIHVTANGEIRCSTNWAHQSDDALEGDCGMFAGTGMARRMRAARSEATATGIVTFAPEGAPAPAGGSADYGTRLEEVEVALNVAADGRISACRVVRQHLLAPERSASTDICNSYPVSSVPIFEPAGAAGEARVIHVTKSVHLRGAVPDLTP